MSIYSYLLFLAILTITGNITEKDRKKGQVLDTLKVERDRGTNEIQNRNSTFTLLSTSQALLGDYFIVI